VLRAREGCRESFRVLVTRHQRGVLSFVSRSIRNRDDAEDVAQEVFLQAWQGIDRHDPRWRFSTWLYTIAARRVASRLRRVELVSQPDGAGELEAGVDPADAATKSDEARALWRLADEVLTPDQRHALWLHYAEDLGAGEIARVLGKSPVAVRLLLFRARRALADSVVRRRELRHRWRTRAAARGDFECRSHHGVRHHA